VKLFFINVGDEVSFHENYTFQRFFKYMLFIVLSWWHMGNLVVNVDFVIIVSFYIGRITGNIVGNELMN